MKENKCIFCKIIAEEINSEKVDESENFIAIRDVNPKSEGHSLIIPKKHVDDFLGLDKGLGNELVEFVGRVAGEVVKDAGASGFNLLVNNGKDAGQVVEHLHIHIIPRKQGDGLTVIA
jgi:histidine triad (HIT) family protein